MSTQIAPSFTPPALPRSLTGAPLKAPSAAKRRARVYPPFRDFMLGTLRAIHADGHDHELKRVRAHVEAHNMYAGRQIGYVSDVTFEWIDTQSADDPYQIDNIVQPMVDILETEMSRVQITLDAKARDESSNLAVNGAKQAQDILRDELKRLKDPFFTQRENKFAILTGDYYRLTLTEDDPDAKPLRVPRALTRKVAPTSAARAYICPTCGETMPLDSDDASAEADPAPPERACPDCLTPMNLIGGAEVEAVGVEYDERPQRRVATISPDPASVRISPSARRGVADSQYVWLKLLMDRGTLEAQFPGIEIPSTGIKSEAMKYQRSLEQQAARANGGDIWDDTSEDAERISGGQQFEKIEVDLVWLRPSCYAGARLPKDEQLPSGVQVQANDEYTKHFPDGMYIMKAGDTILDEAPESIRDRWSSGVFRMIPTSAHGGSISDIINDNRQINELRNLEFYDALYNAAGREIYNKAKISGGVLSGDPSVAVAAENLDENDSLLSAVVVRLPGTNGIPGAERLREQIEGAAQNKTGALPTNLQAATVDVKALGTATGVTALREAAVGRMGPSQALRASVDEEHGTQVLIAKQALLRQQAQRDPSLLKDDGMKSFLELDVRRDLIVSAVEGSWMPLTDSQRQALFQAFMAIASVPNLPREYVQYAAELYKQPYEVDPAHLVRADAQSRLEALLDSARLVEEETAVLDAEGEVKPDAIARAFKFGEVDFDEENDEHAVYIGFYREWLLGADARRATKFARACVRALITQHHEMLIGVETKKTADALRVQSPQLLAKQAQDNQQLEADKARAEAEQETAQDDAEHAVALQMVGGAVGAQAAGAGGSEGAPPEGGAPAAGGGEPEMSDAERIAQTLKITYKDLATQPSPLQEQILNMAGLEVPAGMPPPVESGAGANGGAVHTGGIGG